jgi:hypothetical protein
MGDRISLVLDRPDVMRCSARYRRKLAQRQRPNFHSRTEVRPLQLTKGALFRFLLVFRRGSIG